MGNMNTKTKKTRKSAKSAASVTKSAAKNSSRRPTKASGGKIAAAVGKPAHKKQPAKKATAKKTTAEKAVATKSAATGNGKPKTAKQKKTPAANPAPPQITGDTIGQRIKSGRESLGLAQVPFGELCGLSQGYICDLERERKQPSVDALRKIAAALGTTVGGLLGE